MDQNGISKTEISSDSNKHHLVLIKRTLKFLLPVSLASFLLSYTSTNFSIFVTYYFQYCFTTLVFPLLTHVFERKYMFLICIGILAFLMKTLSFNNSNNSSLSVLDVNGNDSSPKIIEINGLEPAPEPESSSENIVAPGDDEEEKHPAQVEAAAVAVAGAGDEVQGKPNVSSAAAENEGGQTGDFIIESEELKMFSEVDEEEEEDDMGGVLGGALGEPEMDVNMNTEELNKKFEEFIRKMKEELRIQERQQLIAV